MKRTQFEKEPVYRKVCILINSATLIFEYKLNAKMYSLYSLHTYFIEVISTGSVSPAIDDIIVFTEGERLNHYARLFSADLFNSRK